jgi:hypothetical protein
MLEKSIHNTTVGTVLLVGLSLLLLPDSELQIMEK